MASKLQSLQKAFANWCRSFFGHRKGWTRKERLLRFLEESMEVFQAGDITLEEIMTQYHWTYNRPKGQMADEIAGAGNCLLMLAEFEGIDMETVLKAELRKIDTPEMYAKMQIKVNKKIEAGISSCDYQLQE